MRLTHQQMLDGLRTELNGTETTERIFRLSLQKWKGRRGCTVLRSIDQAVVKEATRKCAVLRMALAKLQSK